MDDIRIVDQAPKSFLEAVNASNLNQTHWEFQPSDPEKNYLVYILPDPSLEEDNRNMNGGSVSEFGTAYIISEISNGLKINFIFKTGETFQFDTETALLTSSAHPDKGWLLRGISPIELGNFVGYKYLYPNLLNISELWGLDFLGSTDYKLLSEARRICYLENNLEPFVKVCKKLLQIVKNKDSLKRDVIDFEGKELSKKRISIRDGAVFLGKELIWSSKKDWECEFGPCYDWRVEYPDVTVRVQDCFTLDTESGVLTTQEGVQHQVGGWNLDEVLTEFFFQGNNKKAFSQFFWGMDYMGDGYSLIPEGIENLEIERNPNLR